MRPKSCVLLVAIVAATQCFSQRTIVASSGAPARALDARSGPPDITNPMPIRVTMDSGNLGGSLTERWSAFQFALMRPATFDGIELNYLEKLGSIPTTYGWAIYADSNGRPGSLLSSGSDLYGLVAMTAQGKTYPNAFFVERVGTFPIAEQSLDAGTYWASVYGVDGNLPQFVGAPGGSRNTFASRKTSAGSAYTDFETKSFVMPNYGPLIRAGYDGLGASPPYKYEGWGRNEQQGRDLYHIAYSIVDSTGGSGTVVTGLITIANWLGPVDQYFQNDQSKLQAFDIYFTNVVTGVTQVVQTISVDPTGRFATEKIANGTYDVAVFSRHWYIGRYDCTMGDVVYKQPTVTGFAHPFVPWVKFGVSVSGGTVDLGEIVLSNGDTDLDCQVGLQDINAVLINFMSNVTIGCPPAWDTYVFADDCDGDGLVGLTDLNAVLLNFIQAGPGR